jgi:hypothetical protein
MNTQEQIREAYQKGYADAVRNLIYTPESIAQAMGWEGNQITALFLDVLTDANFHQLREQLEPVVKQHLEG